MQALETGKQVKQTLAVGHHAEHPTRDRLSAPQYGAEYLGGSNSIICRGNAPISLHDNSLILRNPDT